MYNETQKLRFVKDYAHKDSTKKVVLTLFEATGVFEEQWGADLCTKTADELQPMVDAITGLKSKSRIAKLGALKEYVRWCINAGVPDACDGMLTVQENSLGKLREQMVASPLHLHKCLNRVFPPEELNTIDNTYRCFLWLAFAGMTENDALSITGNDIDFVYGIVRFQDKEYPLYKESIPAFKKAVESVQFKHIAGTKEYNRPRVLGEQILRGIKTMPDVYAMRTVISKRVLAAEKLGIEAEMLTYRRVQTSGLFYRMYELERAGEPVNFSEEAIRLTDPKVASEVGTRFYKHRLKMKREGLETDYARWKLSFQN